MGNNVLVIIGKAQEVTVSVIIGKAQEVTVSVGDDVSNDSTCTSDVKFMSNILGLLGLAVER